MVDKDIFCKYHAILQKVTVHIHDNVLTIQITQDWHIVGINNMYDIIKCDDYIVQFASQAQYNSNSRKQGEINHIQYKFQPTWSVSSNLATQLIEQIFLFSKVLGISNIKKFFVFKEIDYEWAEIENVQISSCKYFISMQQTTKIASYTLILIIQTHLSDIETELHI
ncbi:unnamed protein product [Paramecium octaurelia]|uniref:Uncharacterized protein n=1 Tax=Paramecium octaurelia TaxID=43137 RepID=A0A8S1WQH7_PAROT|nr:unnamed protein product [Paramecium octaurelia]